MSQIADIPKFAALDKPGRADLASSPHLVEQPGTDAKIYGGFLAR
jgi:hypothetical protein